MPVDGFLAHAFWRMFSGKCFVAQLLWHMFAGTCLLAQLLWHMFAGTRMLQAQRWLCCAGEPSAEDTLTILEGLKDRYERHHHCLYDHAALEACARLSERYIADRFLPDKAIDIMDEAGSRVRIAAYFARERSGQAGSMDPVAWEELQQVMDAKDEAVKVRVWQPCTMRLHVKCCVPMPMLRCMSYVMQWGCYVLWGRLQLVNLCV
jgi:hypothetical protein